MGDSRRDQAERLLGQIEDVLVDHEIFGWPWWPFRPASDEELRDSRRAKIVRQLRDETDPTRRLKFAEQLVELGGYEIEDGNLELSRGSFRFYDHFQRLEKIEPLEDFCGVFDRYVKWWNGGDPDWVRIGQELIRHMLVQPIDLKNVSLAELRHCLPQLSEAMATEQDVSFTRETHDFTWTFDGSNWIVRFREEEGLFTDMEGMFYYAMIIDSRNESKALSGLELCAVRNRSTPEALSEMYLGGEQRQYDRKALDDVDSELLRLEEDLEAAETTGNDGRATEIQAEIDELKKVKAEGKGFRGHKRRLDGTGYQKSADAVRKALKRARSLIQKKGMQCLANHLESAVRQVQGTFPYRPDESIDWQIDIRK